MYYLHKDTYTHIIEMEKPRYNKKVRQSCNNNYASNCNWCTHYTIFIRVCSSHILNTQKICLKTQSPTYVLKIRWKWELCWSQEFSFAFCFYQDIAKNRISVKRWKIDLCMYQFLIFWPMISRINKIKIKISQIHSS